MVDWALKFTNVVIRPDYRLYVCESLLDEAKAVDNFVQTEVTVLPGVHGGVFSLEQRREKGEKKFRLVNFCLSKLAVKNQDDL